MIIINKQQKITVLSVFLFLFVSIESLASQSDWMHYGGDEGGGRYSSLSQINRANVGQLEVAWKYKTGHLDRVPENLAFLKKMVGFQVTPIILPDDVGGALILCTPFNEIIALNPINGEKKWSYDPKIDLRPFAGRFSCRGLAQWRNPKLQLTEICAHSLFLAANDKRLIAVDAQTGELCPAFGNNGIVDVTPVIKI